MMQRKLEKGRWKGFFCFVETTAICFGSTKMEISTGKKAKLTSRKEGNEKQKGRKAPSEIEGEKSTKREKLRRKNILQNGEEMKQGKRKMKKIQGEKSTKRLRIFLISYRKHLKGFFVYQIGNYYREKKKNQNHGGKTREK